MLLRQYIKMIAQNCILPVYYSFFRYGKIKRNMVIFADAHHNQRPVSMELLYRHLQKNRLKMENLRLRSYIWITRVLDLLKYCST